MTIRLVLFDFDGTLADTAPDLAAATQALLAQHGKAPAPYALLRQVCSSGARGLIKAGFGIEKDDPAFEPLRQDFLRHYRDCLTAQSRLFDGIPSLLAALQARGVAWGIVTNKATDLTTPIVAQLCRHSAAFAPPVSVICGDTTAFTKPHPAPIQAALAQAGVAADQAIYLGDDQRDISAGQAAGVISYGVDWGYHGADDPPSSWGASAVFSQAAQVLQYLD